MGDDPDPNPKAYVKLKDGTLIQPKTFTTTSNKIIADGKSYNQKKIRACSDGRVQYIANPNGYLIPLKYTGKLNVYSLNMVYVKTDMRTGVEHTHSKTFEYFTNGNDFLIPLDYKPLSKVILPGTPPFDYLKLSKSKDRIGGAKMIGGIACILGGFATVVSGFSPQGINGTRAAIGGAIAAGGFGLIVSGAITKRQARQNRRRAVACYNGVLPPITKK